MHHIICVWQNFFPGKGSTSRSSFEGVNTGLWFLSTIWRDSRDLAIMDTLWPNIHLGSLETQINNTKIKRWFQSWNLAVWRIIKGSMYHRFGSRFVFLLSSLTNHKIKVRVLVIWRVRILGLIIRCTPLGSISTSGSTVAIRELTLWGALWTTAGCPERIDSTKDSCTCRGLSEEWVEGRHP